MKTGERGAGGDVCVWIVATDAWEPLTPFDEPAARRVLFPALDRSLTRQEAAAFVAGFNEQMLAHGGRRWAIARRSMRSWSEERTAALMESGCEYEGGVVVAGAAGA
jgi:hypothetical protein